MSEYQARPGSFNLFPNKRKEAGDKKPDYTGNGAGLDGTPLQIAGWIKEGKNGKYMSLQISEPQRREETPPPAVDDGDAPF